MQIEVASPEGSLPKEKGDLLEKLAQELLRIQNYEVTSQIRVTASELDLLCEHRVNRRSLYVECKAHRAPLSADHLKKILGTLEFHRFQEAWLVSAGPLGKDAKGFQHEWETRPAQEAQRLSIYTPERNIDAMRNAHVIQHPPLNPAIERVGSEERLGEWILLITPYGYFWTVTCLEGGVPAGVLVYYAKSGRLVEDTLLLRNLAGTDTSLSSLDFDYVARLDGTAMGCDDTSGMQEVVEVQQGENWRDYRPARPDHFVGRREAQNRVIHFLEAVRTGKSNTRIFAITGDSGMGKSSLIAKLRARVGNVRYRRKFFIYAVDVRAATSASYVFLSVLACVRRAVEQGFGSEDSARLKVTSSSDPLQSESITRFLGELERKKQVVCLIFDQFEELYSKPELFDVFVAMQRLLLSAASLKSHFVLGFAWKTDSTVHQDHPAYYLWQRLADHRLEVPLGPFMYSEASKAIAVFERELGEQLRPHLRRQLIENSQGYPWLLKKLSIHVYDQIHAGASQAALVDKALDVKSLFDRDLQDLAPAEHTCLKMIAESAPADWYECLESSGQEVLRGLVEKRLVVRSGDRLNLYWDIFREYVLTKTVPSIPLSYLPASPSIASMLRVAEQLGRCVSQGYVDLSQLADLSKKTTGNVVRDLIMFGVATGGPAQVRLDPSLNSSDPDVVLRKLRHIFRRHAVTMRLSKLSDGAVITMSDMIGLLKQINPAAQNRERTWNVYARRMGDWLCVTGYLLRTQEGWLYRDQGKPNPAPPKARRRHGLFLGDTSPSKTVAALEWLREMQPQSSTAIQREGFRNAVAVLRRLRLVETRKHRTCLARDAEEGPAAQIVWNAARSEPTLQKVVEHISQHATIGGSSIGQLVNDEYKRNWSLASRKRIGNSLKQWAVWILSGIDTKQVPTPPGRRSRPESQPDAQRQLFRFP